MAKAPATRAAIAKNLTSFDMDEPPAPPDLRIIAAEGSARDALFPPAAHLRHDHRSTNAIFLRQPGLALPLGIGAGLDAPRPDDDTRPAPDLRGQVLRIARVDGGAAHRVIDDLRRRRRRNAGEKHGRQDGQAKTVAILHHAQPTRYPHNGCPFRLFRQPGARSMRGSAEAISQAPSAV